MEVLFVTDKYDSLGLATKLSEEGVTCKVYSRKAPAKFGDGFFEFVTHPFEAIKSCNYIISEGVVDDKIFEWAKTFNKPIIGNNPLTDAMNQDVFREFTVAQKLGVPIPQTEVINDLSDMYSKVLNWNSSRTLIRYDRKTIVCDYQKWLAWAIYKLPMGKKILLQTTQSGHDMSVFGWFDGIKWGKPFLLKTSDEFSLKASSTLALYDREWLEKVLEPWGSFLKVVNYKGPFSIKLNALKDKVEVMSTYAGFEFPSVYAFFEGLKVSIGEFLYKVAMSNIEKIDITSDYMSCAIVSTQLQDFNGVPIIGLEEGNKKHIFFNSVDRQGNDIILKKGGPWLYAIGARGRDVSESLGRLYFTSGNVIIPEINIMTNLKSVYLPWFAKTKALGYL